MLRGALTWVDPSAALVPDFITINHGLEMITTVSLFTSPAVPVEAVGSASRFSSQDDAKVLTRTMET